MIHYHSRIQVSFGGLVSIALFPSGLWHLIGCHPRHCFVYEPLHAFIVRLSYGHLLAIQPSKAAFNITLLTLPKWLISAYTPILWYVFGVILHMRAMPLTKWVDCALSPCSLSNAPSWAEILFSSAVGTQLHVLLSISYHLCLQVSQQGHFRLHMIYNIHRGDIVDVALLHPLSTGAHSPPKSLMVSFYCQDIQSMTPISIASGTNASPAQSGGYQPPLDWWINTSMHGVSFVLMATEVLFSRMRMHIRMVVIILINIILYMLLTFIIYARYVQSISSKSRI